MRPAHSPAQKPQVLEKLAGKYPMAVVTGRPKSDCDFALTHFGIAHLFKVLFRVLSAMLASNAVE